MATVNAYAGPGQVQLFIEGSGPGKAYKLATLNCNIALTIATGAVVHLWATIDCAQTAQSCIQLGPSGQVAEQAKENYRLEGSGTLVGGASLTLAGVYVEPGVLQFQIHDLQFGKGNTGSAADGFGATNATLGNCTNYAIYVDSPVATGYIEHNFVFIASSSTTVGGCGFANPSQSGGSNTIFYNNNVVATSGNVAGGTQCGSVGILDGGTLGASVENNVYGIGMPFRIQGIGHRAIGNQVDSAGCVAKGVNAAFHIGANGTSTPIQNVTIESNIVQVITGHTLDLLALAGDSSATLTGFAIIGNQNNSASNGAMFPSTLACTTQSQPCLIAGNQGFTVVNPSLSGVNAGGWGVGEQVDLVFSAAAQGANLGSTSIGNAPIGNPGFLYCTVEETVRDATSSTLPSCVISYTSQVSSTTITRTVTATNTSNVVGAIQDGFIGISVAAGNAINISTTGYASNVAGTMKYQVQAFYFQY